MAINRGEMFWNGLGEALVGNKNYCLTRILLPKGKPLPKIGYSAREIVFFFSNA